MKSFPSFSILSLLTTLVIVSSSSSSQEEICRFKVLIWEKDHSCIGPPDSESYLYADGNCHMNNELYGPGNYQAYCGNNGSGNNDVFVFTSSGCKEECPSVAIATDDDDSNLQATCEISSTSTTTSDIIAQRWFSVDPVNNFSPPLEAHIIDPSIQLSSFVCYRMLPDENNDVGPTVFSYAIFGDCSECGSLTTTDAVDMDDVDEDTPSTTTTVTSSDEEQNTSTSAGARASTMPSTCALAVMAAAAAAHLLQ